MLLLTKEPPFRLIWLAASASHSPLLVITVPPLPEREPPVQRTVPRLTRVPPERLTLPLMFSAPVAGMASSPATVPPVQVNALVADRTPGPCRVPLLKLILLTVVLPPTLTAPPLAMVTLSSTPGMPLGLQLPGVNQSEETAPVQV